MLSFTSNRVVAVGEAMIEMAVVGDGAYRKSFAGDTFNTAWHMSQVDGANLLVRFVTKVGTDTISAEFIAGLEADGLETSHIGRISNRTMGLYLIELTDTERSFHYWRQASAARLLANDEEWLARSLQDAGLIHVSGITLGILEPDARTRLMSVLASARTRGTRVSFDPNVRPNLWSSRDEARNAIADMLNVTDIAMPSFDDEATLWGDTSPKDTIERLEGAEISEIVIKNSANPVTFWSGDEICAQACPPVCGICDTSGAGDAFNAGYLAARLSGFAPKHAVVSGQTMSATVLQHYGARIAVSEVPSLEKLVG